MSCNLGNTVLQKSVTKIKHLCSFFVFQCRFNRFLFLLHFFATSLYNLTVKVDFFYRPINNLWFVFCIIIIIISFYFLIRNFYFISSSTTILSLRILFFSVFSTHNICATFHHKQFSKVVVVVARTYFFE